MRRARDSAARRASRSARGAGVPRAAAAVGGRRRSSLTAFFAYGIIRAAAAGALPGRGDARRTVVGRHRRAAAPRPRRVVHVLRLPAAEADVARRHVGRPVPARGRGGRRRSGSACSAASGARRARARAPRGRSRRPRWSSLHAAPTSSGSCSLLLFAPPFGLVQLPFFFDPHSYAPPLQDPWDFLRSMLVPWLRRRRAAGGGDPAADAGADARRDGRGLRPHRAGEGRSRTAGGAPARGAPTYVSVASLFGASAPFMVTNMVLVEYVYSVPGLLPAHEARARPERRAGRPVIDIPTLQALALWAAVLIVALSLLADLAIVRAGPADPRRRGDPG